MAAGIVVAFFLVGCSPSAPARWASGGAGLDIAAARWSRKGSDVAIAPSGLVTVNGEPTLAFDTSGRVRDADGDPFALLEQGGRLVGNDDSVLGTVKGASVVATGTSPSVTVQPSGEIAFKDATGEHPAGAWVGDCARSPSAQSFCSVVAYVVTVEENRRYQRLEDAENRKQRTRPR